MGLTDRSPVRLKKALKSERRRMLRLAKKFEATQAKLAKRMHKLRTAESKIAHLQQLLVANPASGGAKNLAAGERTATLIYNPTCGAASKERPSLDDIIQLLGRHGIQVNVKIKTCGKDARRFAQEAITGGGELIIVAGGDGTIEDVAAQLVGAKTVLGILPIGTMNNVARSLGVPLDLEQACALLAVGSTRRIDVGHVKIKGKQRLNYFLETAGLGVTALTFPVGQAAKKGKLSVLPRGVRKLFDHKPGPVQIVLDDGEPVLANAQLVTVSNAPLMGLNFLIAPAAKMDDGLLDVAVYEGMGKTDLLEFFMATRNAQRVDNPKVKRYQASKVRIQSQTEQPVHSDKDELPAQSDLSIEIIPQALSMVVGNGLGLNAPSDALEALLPLTGPSTDSALKNGEPVPDEALAQAE